MPGIALPSDSDDEDIVRRPVLTPQEQQAINKQRDKDDKIYADFRRLTNAVLDNTTLTKSQKDIELKKINDARGAFIRESEMRIVRMSLREI
jgi:hypothetical protein